MENWIWDNVNDHTPINLDLIISINSYDVEGQYNIYFNTINDKSLVWEYEKKFKRDNIYNNIKKNTINLDF